MNGLALMFLSWCLLCSAANAQDAKSLSEESKARIAKAEEGDANSQFNLGGMFVSADGVERNPSEALKWFQKAANQGHANAQLNLGLMYANGVGVTKDVIEAYAWVNIASSNGHSHAKEIKASLCSHWTEAQLEQAQKRTEKLLMQIEEKAKSAK